MKWIKKILRIIAIILPVFSTIFISRSSFAKSYPVNSFLSHGISTVKSDGSKAIVATQPTLYLDDTSDLDFIHDMYFLSSKSGDQCQFTELHRRGYQVYQKEVSFGSYFVFPYYELLSQSNISDDAICQSYSPFGGSYNNFKLPTYNRLSAPLGYQPDIGAVQPYSYDYATVSKEKPSNWVSSSAFDITRIQGYDLPINFGAWDDLEEGENLKLDFGFVWPANGVDDGQPMCKVKPY